MRTKKIRIIIFDLNTKELKKELGNKTIAYNKLKIFFIKHNFEWIQRSTYRSTLPMSKIELDNLLEELRLTFPWLKICLTKINIVCEDEVLNIDSIFK